jgi:mono/diheme cytochrome c family protein
LRREPTRMEKCENRSVSLPGIRLFGLLLLTASFAASSNDLYAAKAAEKAGAVLFRDKGCAYCHGATAQGTPKGPSLAQVAAQIENGGQKMPSFSDSLTHDQVAQLVAWLCAKHRPLAPPVSVPAQTPAP